MKQYSFYNTDLLIDGLPVDGFPESNQIIRAGRNAGQHGSVVGARGEMSVSTSANLSGVFTFSLLQTSDWNSTMNSRAVFSQNTGLSGNKSLFTPIQAMLNDKMGETKVTGVNGHIPMRPVVVRGTGIVVNTWTIVFEEVHFAEGKYAKAGI